MDTPIDGFGQPKIYLSLLRMICSNGAIGYSPTFRSEIPMGKDMAYCIARALESYDNGDGFAALRQRFEAAQRSWASLFECHQLYKLLVRMVDQRAVTREGVLHDFYRVTRQRQQPLRPGQSGRADDRSVSACCRPVAACTT